jgi:hypothetical protein
MFYNDFEIITELVENAKVVDNFCRVEAANAI